MSVETASLWPVDFGEPVLLTPLAILRQQGAALGEQTKNIVMGRVTTQSDGDGFSQFFSLYCAPLGYHTDLVVVKHGIDLYPAWVIVVDNRKLIDKLKDLPPISLSTKSNLPEGQQANDPEHLKNILKEIFARPDTKKIIASLLAQSRQ